MELDHPRKPAPEPLLATWIKWTMDFWEDLAHLGPGPEGRDAGQSEGNLAALTLWQAFFSLLSDSGTVSAVFRGIKAPSEIVLKLAQAGWNGYFYLHQQWLEGFDPEASQDEAGGFEDLDQEIFKVCAEIYEKDFRELLNLTPVTRLSEEGLVRVRANFSQFKRAMGEFIFLLFLPLKKSLREMRGVFDEGGRPLEDFKEYYHLWLRVLEGHYMTLLKSPEYTRTMSQTLIALEEFNLAQEELLSAALAPLPLPSQRQMDELCREIYLLKKQVKLLAQQQAEAAADGPGEG